MKMKRFIRTRPRPGTIIAIVALVVALSGTAVAAGGFLPKQKFTKFKGQVLKTLTYVTTTTAALPDNQNYPGTRVSANCPGGFHVIGGGIKVSDEANSDINDSYPTTSGWAGNVNTYTGGTNKTATTTAICALTKSATGSPPSS
jgi:hypothetical protein